MRKKIVKKTPGAAETITISMTLDLEKLSKGLSGAKGQKLLEQLHTALHQSGITSHDGFVSMPKRRRNTRRTAK